MSSRAEKTEELSNSVVGKGKREFDANVILGTFETRFIVCKIGRLHETMLSVGVKSRRVNERAKE